ncbi:hypothetical protein H072_8790 [Dactylellina haptotyla CBS 200.50]|uniref:Uncharacterized protein n=1 Tax=Dactylellina haptotyla (strain CBS 200.50) TaxID=1284197 RepID=S8A419_DACHA|nr:hypothetical protein H072_8790 [Dactylellina haptotyla CBS 200.50]
MNGSRISCLDFGYRDDDILKLASSIAYHDNTTSTTKQTLESLFLASNQLRVQAEEFIESLSCLPRAYSAIEQAMVKRSRRRRYPFK